MKTEKANLKEFMQENFRQNLGLKNLAILTGRSLATFKRDFEKTFHTSPKKWIQQRRLEEAYFLMKEQGKRPSEVYDELGFETFSHFSFAFKQYFGANPSNIQSR